MIMSSDSISLENPPTTDVNQLLSDGSYPLLPRRAWNSHLAYLRAIFKAKKALDRIEREAPVSSINYVQDS